jgi:hypothetical protein
MELTRENYFSPEAEALYLGSSSFKAWDRCHDGGCEAREVAKRKGEWVDKPNPAFLLGQYVHSWNSNDLPEFIAEHPELFKKGGYELLAKYALGDTMIEIFKNDPAMMKMREGVKESIFTGEINGVPFKIQVDILNILEGYFADIKTTKGIYDKYWNNENREYESFIQHYDYPLQFSIYAEILRQNYNQILEDALNIYTEKQLDKFIKLIENNRYLDCYILAVDKQETPDHEVIFMDLDGFIKEKLQEIELKLPNIMAVRNGEVEPERCGKCEFCRSTKKITKPIHWLDLGSDLR